MLARWLASDSCTRDDTAAAYNRTSRLQSHRTERSQSNIEPRTGQQKQRTQQQTMFGRNLSPNKTQEEPRNKVSSGSAAAAACSDRRPASETASSGGRQCCAPHSLDRLPLDLCELQAQSLDRAIHSEHHKRRTERLNAQYHARVEEWMETAVMTAEVPQLFPKPMSKADIDAAPYKFYRSKTPLSSRGKSGRRSSTGALTPSAAALPDHVQMSPARFQTEKERLARYLASEAHASLTGHAPYAEPHMYPYRARHKHREISAKPFVYKPQSERQRIQEAITARDVGGRAFPYEEQKLYPQFRSENKEKWQAGQFSARFPSLPVFSREGESTHARKADSVRSAACRSERLDCAGVSLWLVGSFVRSPACGLSVLLCRAHGRALCVSLRGSGRVPSRGACVEWRQCECECDRAFLVASALGPRVGPAALVAPLPPPSCLRLPRHLHAQRRPHVGGHPRRGLRRSLLCLLFLLLHAGRRRPAGAGTARQDLLEGSHHPRTSALTTARRILQCARAERCRHGAAAIQNLSKAPGLLKSESHRAQRTPIHCSRHSAVTSGAQYIFSNLQHFGSVDNRCTQSKQAKATRNVDDHRDQAEYENERKRVIASDFLLLFQPALALWYVLAMASAPDVVLV